METQRRLEELLDKLNLARTAEGRRMLRALEVLERIGNADAGRLLKRLANGAADAALTQEAKASLDRLNRQRMPVP